MEKKARTERRDEYNAKRRRKRSPERNHEAYRQRALWLLNGDVTGEELITIFEQAKGRCNYCGTTIKRPRFNPFDPRGFDHVQPRTKGGRHTKANIVVACRRCNELKGDAGALGSIHNCWPWPTWSG